MTIITFQFVSLSYFEAIPALSIGRTGLMISWLFWALQINWEQADEEEQNEE